MPVHLALTSAAIGQKRPIYWASIADDEVTAIGGVCLGSARPKINIPNELTFYKILLNCPA
jgi:hypothetical protein